MLIAYSYNKIYIVIPIYIDVKMVYIIIKFKDHMT